MTREEAIEICRSIMPHRGTPVFEALDMAIKALEQQPCEDCISRAEVLKILEKEEFKGDAIYEIEKKLPPVTPTRSTGKWIKYQEPWGGMQGWKCSNCKNHYDVSSVYTIIPYNYCPNCGAEMSGGREDESIREDKTI